MAAATLDIGEVMHTITIRVTGMKLASFRIRLAAVVFGFGAWIAGTGLEMDMGDR